MTDYVSLGFIPFESVLRDAEMGADALLLCSGGLDSAYCLYKYSKAAPNRKVNIHHVKLYPSLRKRHSVEEVCLQKQIQLASVDVNLIKSTVEICDKFNTLPMRDFFMAVVLSVGYAMRNKLKYIVVGDDIIDGFVRGAASKADGDSNFLQELIGLKSFVDGLSHGKCQLSLSMSKTDVYSEYMSLPDQYLATCFSCRDPRFVGEHVEACGTCIACNRNYMLGIKDKLCKRMRMPQ